MSFFYEDQAYPGNDPFEVARQMGIPMHVAMQMLEGNSPGPYGGMGGGMGGMGAPNYDPNMMAEMVGQQYNPYQGYPTKQVSDQVWDVMGPMDEYLLPQMYNIQNPDRDQFDLDTFFASDPTVRGALAEAYTQAEGDTMGAYNYLQSNEAVEGKNAQGEDVITPGFRDRFAKQVGRTEWEQLARQGYQPIIQAAKQNASPQEIDKIAVDYLMEQMLGTMAGGAPTSQRATSQLDYTRQSEGFRPAPGTGMGYPSPGGPDTGMNMAPAFGGATLDSPIGYEDGSVDLGNGMVLDAETGQVRPQIGGGGQPGIGGGSDPLADLARSPQYGGGGDDDREMIPGPNFGQAVWQGRRGQLVDMRMERMPSFRQSRGPQPWAILGSRGRPSRGYDRSERRREYRQDANGGGGSGGVWGRFVRSLRPGPG